MIRIRRGPEPAALPPVRRSRLASVETHAQAGTLERRHIIGYSVVKPDLWRSQHYKCCYCEKNNLEASHSDVEHFRPALRAIRGPGFSDHGYWWLAWTWKNLMFSCKNCNESAKNDRFPLAAGSIPLQPQERVTGKEIPLLIDPCVEDPLNHIQFRPVPKNGKVLWIPYPRAKSEKGKTTIDVLKLHRQELLDLYFCHVEQHVAPVLDRLHVAILTGNPNTVRNIWNKEITNMVNPRFPFAALSFDVVDHFVSAVQRRTWKLKLRRP